MIEVNFSVKIHLNTIISLYHVSVTNDKELKSFNIVRIKKNGGKKVQFYLKIIGKLKDSILLKQTFLKKVYHELPFSQLWLQPLKFSLRK